jgi:hypothetical protein
MLNNAVRTLRLHFQYLEKISKLKNKPMIQQRLPKVKHFC